MTEHIKMTTQDGVLEITLPKVLAPRGQPKAA